MKKVAIFDVDGTIFRSSFLIELTDALIDESVFDASVAKRYEKEKKKWFDRRGDYESYIGAVIAAFMENLKGVSFADFDRVSKRMVALHCNRVYRYTRDLTKILRRKRYFLLAISQSPKGVLDSFCRSLGFHKVYGRFYRLGPQNRFTGEVEDLHLIANKANIVRRVVAKEKLTLKGSVGVGDTEDDIPFLELVETPICFNPNRRLYRYAKLNGWKIVVERKDVIYELD